MKQQNEICQYEKKEEKEIFWRIFIVENKKI